MEFGPRALGNKYIGNPQNVEMQKTMNLKIKFRESFRPFAPIIKEDKVKEWFSEVDKSRYMLLVADLNSNKIYKKKKIIMTLINKNLLIIQFHQLFM